MEMRTAYTMRVYVNNTFDGDTLNIVSIINKDFQYAAERVFNPANAMIISKNDGYFNNGYNNQRDCFINCNTMMQLCRSYYSQEEIDRLLAISHQAV